MDADAKQDRDGDDGLRGDSGVVVSLVDRPNGKVRLVFDDVQRDPAATPPITWTHEFFYTRTEVDLDALLETDVSEEMLAQIGLNIVARLAAHKKVLKDRSSR